MSLAKLIPFLIIYNRELKVKKDKQEQVVALKETKVKLALKVKLVLKAPKALKA